MRSAVLIAFAVVLSWGHARAELPRVKQRVSIEASVDLERHRVRGTTTIDFENTSRVPLTELVFHRYLEAFRDDRSVFIRESRGQLRGVDVRGRGGLELRALTVDGVDRLRTIERELVPEDFTQFRLPLAAPLAPGARTTIRIDFIARLPPLAVRAGYVGDFHIVAQWFPKLAKLEDDGSFASFPYHGLGEFYADFADYDVTLSIPESATVEGTGVIGASRSAGGRRTVRFEAKAVHDVAYVVARGFETTTSRCDGVTIRTAFPRAFAWAAREHTDETCVGLRFLSSRLGRYPYPTLTVILPPENADGGAGMEYPTAFITAGPWFPTSHTPYSEALETTMHELAHQWFQGIVATNEVAHPVLDEGLSSFLGYDLMRVYTRNDDAAHFDWWRNYVTRAEMIPARGSVESFDDYSYGSSVYGRSAVVLESIARVYGRDRLYRALGRYARQNAFAHPGPDALLDAFDAEYGHDFGRRVVAKLLLDGERVVLQAERRPDGRLRAMVRTDVGVPVEVELRADRGTTRTTLRGPGELLAPVGTRCITIDPDERWLLDPIRRDDVACTEPTNEPLRAKLFAAAAALIRWVGP